MERKPRQDDELVMSLVEMALAQPENQRESYLETACSGNPDLFNQARHYVQWEARMRGFLLDPLCPKAEEENPFQRGQLLDGRFRIEREVARGGMGIVYQAFDDKLDRRIALKCARSGFRKRLPPEVRHASEISHPNICKIFEIHTASTENGEVDFLTMEFLEGETLAARLGRGRLPEAEARVIGTQICAGLAEAHRNRVVHGDLKSNNVILVRDASGAMRAVITDFGLARKPLGPAEDIAFDAKGSSQAGGTPDYMAPELWKGEKPSAASDVYALGVMLYELASGRKPFGSAASTEDLLTRKPPALHNRWDRVLARCLDPDPVRRFSSAVEVEQALAPSTSLRWILAAAAAAVLVIGTGVAMYRLGDHKESWKLTMPPVESDGETKDLADRLSHDAAAQLARLKGGDVARLTVLPFDPKAKATHYVHASLTKKDDKLVLRAWVTDARTGVNKKEWTAEYAPGEMRYAPVALAGMVTSDLGLPPLSLGASVNSAAAQDYWSGLWYMRRNSTIDQALPLLERAVAEDGDSPLTFAALAEARQWKWFLTKDGVWLDRAKESEQEARRRNPDLEQVHRVAGLLDYRQGLHEQATEECRRAVALDPNDGEAHRVLGQAYEASNRLDEALAEFRRSVEVDTEDYRNHQQLGAFHFHRGNYAEALPSFQRAMELSPEEPATHRSLGLDYSSLGRLPEAESELRLAILLGETPEELHSLGSVLIEEGKYTEAAESILRALSLAPGQSQYEMNLGTAYRLMNRERESDEAYRRALGFGEREIARDRNDARGRSYLAFVCARLGDPNRAASEIKQALQTSPNDGAVRFMAVATDEAMSNRDAALSLLNTFSRAELDDVRRWPDLADLSQDSRFLKLLASSQNK